MTETITRILVPVDFSAHSDRALRYATALASRLGASIELFHVVDDPFATGAWSSEIYVSSVADLINDVIAAARRRLAEMKPAAANEGIPVNTVVLAGRPASAIVEHASADGFDLIVMGTHGRTGLSHVFMGSVAEKVVRRAPCPVLTLRETAPTAEETSATRAVAIAS